MEIIKYPDNRLTSKCIRVEDFDQNLVKFTNDLVKCMKENNGAGLAASQVGSNLRVMVIDFSEGKHEDSLLIFVNPRITWKSTETISTWESCLSIPSMTFYVERHSAIALTYQISSGETRDATFVGYSARIIQHEIDHLDGILLFDRSVQKQSQKEQNKEARA
jgi:peptide deformylase